MICFLKEPPWIFVCPSQWPRLYRLTLAKQFLIFGQQHSVSSAEMCRYLQLPQHDMLATMWLPRADYIVATMCGMSHELHLGELLASLTALQCLIGKHTNKSGNYQNNLIKTNKSEKSAKNGRAPRAKRAGHTVSGDYPDLFLLLVFFYKTQ